jgi:hypothetical protein
MKRICMNNVTTDHMVDSDVDDAITFNVACFSGTCSVINQWILFFSSSHNGVMALVDGKGGALVAGR